MLKGAAATTFINLCLLTFAENGTIVPSRSNKSSPPEQRTFSLQFAKIGSCELEI
jgi:hypothetical protein